MFQNIKVDVIYYKTGTDFEMEFNLSGCCRMRLLTYKAPDRKVLVSQLARAVSRSRIIIIAGSLFGDEGIIKTSAAAIGRNITVADNKQFGIDGDDKIEIIENSVPLVTKNGIFGGCIIEQGPQTLILLSDNKNIRKNIMKNLIHPYVQEVCASELTEHGTVSNTDETDTIPDETTEEPQVTMDDTDETEYDEEDIELVIDDEENDQYYDFEQEDVKLASEMVMEDEEYFDQALKSSEEGLQDVMTGSDELIFEDEDFDETSPDAEIINRAYLDNQMDAYIDASDYIVDEEGENAVPTFVGWGINLPIIIVAVILLIVGIILFYCIFLVPGKQGIATSQYLKELFNTLFG